MIDISGKSFSPSNTQQYTLSIRFLPDGFCFAILDEEGRVVHFTQENHSDTALTSIDLLHRPFKETFLCCDSNRYTLLPKNIFQEKDIPSYWNLNFGSVSSEEELLHNEIRLLDIINVFSVDKKQLAEVRDLFPAIRLIHKQSAQINRSVRKNKQEGGKQIYIYMSNDYFDVVLVNHGTLLLANTFSSHNDDEFLYFILNVFDQLKLDQYSIPTIVGGVHEEDEKIEKLRRYLKSVVVDNDVDGVDQNFLREKTFSSNSTQLLNLNNCGI